MYKEKYDLTGKVAVVTGAAQGIGAACCDALAEAGAHVVITDLNLEGAQRHADKLKSEGKLASAYSLDVTKSGESDRLASILVAEHGHVDILVNNAGFVDSMVPAEECSDEHWDRHMRVNIDGVFYCARAFGRVMLNQKSGAIVNLGSMSGLIVNRPQKQSFYNTSKAAVHHMTKSLATEWADRGVRVNAVAPTMIETELVTEVLKDMPEMDAKWREMTPMGRFGSTDEIGSIVHFLSCDASSLMTGSIVVADAGYSCW